MPKNSNENGSQIDLFELISSQRWHKIKVIISKNKDIVKAQHGRCLGMHNSRCKTVQDSSCFNPTLGVNQCLYNCNSRNNALLFACYFHPPLDVIKCIYDAYPKAIQDKDCKGCCPLHIACANGCKSAVIYFMIQEYPQAIWETDVNNRSPIFHACRSYVSKSKHGCKTIANKHLLEVLELLGSLAPMTFITTDIFKKTPLDYVIETEVHPSVQNYVASINAKLLRETRKGEKNKQEVLKSTMYTSMLNMPRKFSSRAA
jgi:hypothetical protein